MAGVPEFSWDKCHAQISRALDWSGDIDHLPCPVCGDPQTRAGGHDDLCGTSAAGRWYYEQERQLLAHPDATRVESPVCDREPGMRDAAPPEVANPKVADNGCGSDENS